MTTNGNKTNKINIPKKAVMSEVQMHALNQALKLLNALPVQYRIETDDGKSFGALQATTTGSGKARKRCLHYPFGTVSAKVKEYCDALTVGDVAQIPLDSLPLLSVDSFYSTIAGWCNNQWGPGAYKMCKTDKHIEVLRVA